MAFRGIMTSAAAIDDCLNMCRKSRLALMDEARSSYVADNSMVTTVI